MTNKDNSNIIKVFVLIIGFLLSSLSGWFLYEEEEKSIISEFHKDVDERAASLYREVSINFEALRSLGILFNGKSVPEVETFSIEAKNILSRYSDIQALEWIPRIPHLERDAYEAKHQQIFPDFEITERKEQGHMVPAKKRDEYFPVYYVEPLKGNEVAFGYDLSSSPTRLKTLQQSRDSATPLATASITLVQDRTKQKGFLAVLPIYKGTPSTLHKRHENLKGFVLGVYRISDIFTSSALNDELLGIEMRLVDDTISSKPDTLHLHKSHTGFGHEEIIYTKKLPEIWGRQWNLVATPTLSYMSVRRDMLPWAIFIAGITFTFFIFFYIHIITKRAAIIQQLVIEKTNDLVEANKKLEFLSQTDGLTQIANRRYMDEFLDSEWLRAIRHKTPVSFILLDIDYFKLFNDNYGHIKGDECLIKVATCLKNQVNRSGDLVARYGGEEFALILSHTENAEYLATRCRQSIENLQIPHAFSEASDIITISIGVCTVIPERGTEPSLLIDAADKALYKAKESGRNRTETIILSL